MAYDQDHDPDDDPENGADGNGAGDDGGAVTSTFAGGALASLAALGAALNGVDTTSVAGRPGMPMLTFKRDGSGTWAFGQKRTVVEDGSRWAVNVGTFKRGYICFSSDNKVIGEHILPIALPMPDLTALPDKGAPWVPQWSVNLKCIDGTDSGAEVAYKPTTVGGIQAITGLIEAVRDRLNAGQHGGAIAPIVNLEKDSYQHGQFGRVWTPALSVVGWMPMSGPAPAPASSAPTSPSPAAAEQPRRRRIG